MTNGVSVTQDVNAFRMAVDRMKDQDMNRAIAIALNRTADGVRAEAIRRIRGKYNVRAAELRRGFTIRKAYAGNLRSIVFANGKPLNVGAFNARQTKKGITVAIKSGGRKTIMGAFFMTVGNNGYRGVFERRFLSGKSGKRHGRYPIRAVTTVSVPGLFRQEVVKEQLAGIVPGRFRTELGRAVRAITLTK